MSSSRTLLEKVPVCSALLLCHAQVPYTCLSWTSLKHVNAVGPTERPFTARCPAQMPAARGRHQRAIRVLRQRVVRYRALHSNGVVLSLPRAHTRACADLRSFHMPGEGLFNSTVSRQT